MPQVALTADELKLLDQALQTSIASAQRAQKQSKGPQFEQVYKEHEATLSELRAKLVKAK